MPWRRFALLTVLFTVVHVIVTVSSVLIAIGPGFDLDHPEVRSSFSQRAFGVFTDILMQPGSALGNLLGVTPRTSLRQLL